jgi:hypothetical protein
MGSRDPDDPASAARVGAKRAYAAFGGTADSPELAGAVWEAMGRMPFLPPSAKPAAPEKRPAKTVQSKVVPRGGQTMALDAGALQRPTPTLPFAGSTGDAGVVYVPHLDARQYVALHAELALQVAPRKETLSRYQVPNEAALRALDEHWRHPGRRAEIEAALLDFAAVLRRQVLR